MSNITTLELRQEDSNLVNANGDYEIVLAKQVEINKGDVVLVKQAFLDTTTEGSIIIPTDLTLVIENGVYITDWYKDTTAKPVYYQEDGTPNNSADEAVSVSCARYIPYKKRAYIPPNDSQIDGYSFLIDFTGSDEPEFQITYSYIDLNDIEKTFHTTFPPLSGRIHSTYIDKFNVVCRKDTLSIVSPSPSFFAELGITIGEPQIAPNPATVDIFEPYIFTTTIDLAAGAYSPTELSLIISERLSRNNVNYSKPYFTNMIQSNFLWASKDFDAGKPEPDNSTGNIDTSGTMFISNDNTYPYAFKFIPDTDYLVGSSQIALEFDQNTNSFVFQFLHSPMLDGATGENISVRYLNFDLDTDNIVATANNGGIFFRGLKAFRQDNNESYDFWGGVLGFDVDSLCVNYLEPQTDIYNQTGITYLVENLVLGQHITDGYYGLDSGVIKGNTSFYKMNSVPNTQAGLSSTINNTVNIVAKKNINQLLTKFSHYIISTDLAFSANEYIGLDNYRTFNSIVSKYYSYAQYTFASTDGSIQYQHNGNTQSIKSIKVRILKSNKQLDTNLGADNTVILQVIKSA